MKHFDKILVLLALGAGCYQPVYPEGKLCAPDGSCPGDMICAQGFQCWSPELAVVQPPDIPPPDRPPFTPEAYGWPCFDSSECPELMGCYINWELSEVGFCTPICGTPDGNINEDLCLAVDPGAIMTFCGLPEEPGGSRPTYCVTLCEETGLCPPDLICDFDPFVNTLTCQARF